MFVYICIFVLAVLWLGIALITLYLFGKYSDLISEYEKLNDEYSKLYYVINRHLENHLKFKK